MRRRLLSLLLVFVMVLGMLPTTALAEETFPLAVTLDGQTLPVISLGSYPDQILYTGDVPWYQVTVPYGTAEGTELSMTYDGTTVSSLFAVNFSITSTPVSYYSTDYYGEFYACEMSGGYFPSTVYCVVTLVEDAAPTNTAPALAGEAEASATVTVGTAYELNLASVFTDADNDTLTYTVSVNGGEAAAAEASYSYTPMEAGTTTLTFTANDGTADSPSYTVTLTAEAQAEEEDPSCLSVAENASTGGTIKAGAQYSLTLSEVFSDSEGHSLTYDFTTTVENQHTKIEEGVFYFSAAAGTYEVTLTAECEEMEASHKLTITVEAGNEGIAAQYNYNETDAESVTVYVTLSNDGYPVAASDGTPMSHLEVTVPYFDLALYGLGDYYRYGTDGGSGPYANETLIKRPTGLHLYIYLLERYYMGMGEADCGKGNSGVLSYNTNTDVLFMDGEPAYKSNGKSALQTSGGPTSIYMVNFWGHDENLMYFRNHCYPYMSEGWGATSDYILLSDGDVCDVAMFSNWEFHTSGFFACFDEDAYRAEAGASVTVSTQKWGTTAAAAKFEAANDLSVALYDEDWELVEAIDYDSDTGNTLTFNAPETAGTYYLMALDPNAQNPESACIAPATAVLTVNAAEKEEEEEERYQVTINVAPSAANVTFYSGSDTTTALTTQVTDNGVVGSYHQYVLSVPEGTYTYRGLDGETNLGGMTFEVPFAEEIMSDGTASGEGLSMTLRRVNYYTTNSKITAIGDYTLRLVPGSLPEVVNGDQYLDDSSRVMTPVLVMARGNALTYQQAIKINGELGKSYAVAPVSNVTFSAGTSAQNKTFTVSSIVIHTIKAPAGAKVQVFNQINNFNVEELTATTVSEPDANGVVTHTFNTTGGYNLTYRVSMEGKITRAGYFGGSAETMEITFDESENPKTTVNSLENATVQKRMESSTMINANSQNDLPLGVGETFRLRSFRAAWQIINTDTMNIMIEPDFHYNVISGGEHISMDIVDDRCTGNATANWVDITGVSAGTAIVEVTYDALQIGGNGTSNDGLYGATDPQRSSLLVIQVGAGERTLQMIPDGRSSQWDTEFDTLYFLGDTGSMTFTAALGGNAPDSVALSTNKGSTWTPVTAADGKYTVTGLIGGNNLLRFTKGSVTEYMVVRAAKVTQTVTNLNRPDGVIAGDQLKVTYSGLYIPTPKFSGIYNPGFGTANTHKVTYTLPEGYTVTASGGQYDFINNHTYILTIPETASGEVTLTGGHVAHGVMGSAPGAHRNLTDAGVGSNMSAGSSQQTRGILPDLTFEVISMPSIAVTVTSNVEGATIVVKDSAGTVLEPVDGIYTLGLGSFTYEATADGYITERGSFDVTLADAEAETKTVALTMRKIEGGIWDGSAATEPAKDANGVYQIGTGAELAWFAANHGNAAAVLTADISLGGFAWTPITKYTGTFDGNGHWITDLYINSTSASQGLFAQLSSSGVIKNLGVRGQVTSTGNYVGGIVAKLSGGTIESCVSDVTISGGQYTGGLAGQQSNSTTIKNSYNLGNVTGTNSKGNVGGISGGYLTASMAFTIENCYNLGIITASRNYGGLTYSTMAANGVNSYYVSGSADDGNSKVGTVKSAAELKAMASTLGDAYAADTNNINNGFPILTWQAGTPDEEETPTVVYGDVNGLDGVDMTDVSLVLAFINGEALDENAQLAADVNCKDGVDMTDVSIIIQYINGTISALPVVETNG